MRRETAGHHPGFEGQGEVISFEARPVPLPALDSSEELLQTGFWGFFKQKHGWNPAAFEVTGGPTVQRLLVLTRKLARIFTIAYVPFGPACDPGAGRGEHLSRIAAAVRPSLPRGTLFLRYDLPWEKKGETPVTPRGLPKTRKSASDMQPASTVIVDIDRPLDAVMESMKPKTRYNARLAEKKGVTVTEGTADDIPRWYAIYRETARRDRIAIHSIAYYRGLLQSARDYPGAAPDVKLLLAWHEGELLAGNIVAFWKTRAAYLYGASSGAKRNLMPTYALQWDAIRRAHAAGCRTYDLYGVPPRPDPGHPMFGLYQFKTGFSETVLERWGTWDVSFRPVLCALYRAAESARMLYYRRVKKAATVVRGIQRLRGA